MCERKTEKKGKDGKKTNDESCLSGYKVSEHESFALHCLSLKTKQA